MATYNYPTKRKPYTERKISTSNRGMLFEELINESNEQYLKRDIAVIHFIGRLKPWSNGGFNLFNVRYFAICISHLRFYELKQLIKYILLSY